MTVLTTCLHINPQLFFLKICPNDPCCSSSTGFCGGTEPYCGPSCQSNCHLPGNISNLINQTTFDEILFKHRSDASCDGSTFYTYDVVFVGLKYVVHTCRKKGHHILTPFYFFILVVQERNMWLAVCFNNRKKIFKIKIDKILININNVTKKFNGLAILFIKKNGTSSKIKRRIDFIILSKKIYLSII